MAGELRVEVVPWGPDPGAVSAAARAALDHPSVRAELGDADARLLSVRLVDADEVDEETTAVRASVYDYGADRMVLVDAPIDGAGAPSVASVARQPPPSREEWEAAVAVVREDAELAAALRKDGVTPYRPMPPVVADELSDGRIERTVTVGLRAAATGAADEIVAVHLGRREVVRFDAGAPAAARVGPSRCGLRNADQRTVVGAPGAARITVSRDDEILWSLVAVRPAASVGTSGSGIELRAVSYVGKQVLRRAHVPILNVRYRRDVCGPFRDWQNEEGRLEAHGDDVAPGFRLCPRPATTVLESGRDRGNFAGVAVFLDGEELVLVSELEAGWYRYVSQWRLHADGTIRPRFGFGAVENFCVCTTHHHHAYWRFHFGIADAADDAVDEFNDPRLPGRESNWHTLRHEIRRKRDRRSRRRWRVRSRASGEGYLIVPGSRDGRADAFGVGDFWALRFRRGQIDDGQGFTTDPAAARAQIDRFVNSESIVGTEVVVWYAGHFSHDVRREHGRGRGHVVGPTLRPERW